MFGFCILDLLNKSFRVYYATTLNNFSFEESSMSKYEALLCKKLPDHSVSLSYLKGLPSSTNSLVVRKGIICNYDNVVMY